MGRRHRFSPIHVHVRVPCRQGHGRLGSTASPLLGFHGSMSMVLCSRKLGISMSPYVPPSEHHHVTPGMVGGDLLLHSHLGFSDLSLDVDGA
jgi:hypothetical protein